RLTGVDGSIEARVTDRLVLRGSHDFVNGVERRTDTPLPLMPPPRTMLGGEFEFGRAGAWHDVAAGANVEINQTQTRLNPEDFATDGYTLLNLDFTAS